MDLTQTNVIQNSKVANAEDKKKHFSQKTDLIDLRKFCLFFFELCRKCIVIIPAVSLIKRTMMASLNRKILRIT